jgi:hypothetical protein
VGSRYSSFSKYLKKVSVTSKRNEKKKKHTVAQETSSLGPFFLVVPSRPPGVLVIAVSSCVLIPSVRPASSCWVRHGGSRID